MSTTTTEKRQPESTTPIRRPGERWPAPPATARELGPPPTAAPPTAESAAGPPAGLCTTCELAVTCAYWRGHNEPVWHCEDFDDRPGAGIARPAAAAVSARPLTGLSMVPRAIPATSEIRPTRGLCVNCEVASECRLPQKLAGVWFCEEYA